MNSTLNVMPPVKRPLLTLGELPSSYLVSMTYEEQLLWLCHFLQTEIVPKLNALITSYNEDIAKLSKEIEDIDASIDARLEAFMLSLENNITEIASTILNEKIQDGSLIVSLGIEYDEPTEELTFSINSEASSEIIAELETLTTPSSEEV